MNFEILQILPRKKVLMNSYEIYYIQHFNSSSPNGYNLKTGGDSCEMSEESKIKIKEKRKNQKFSDKNIEAFSMDRKGKKQTETAKNRIKRKRINRRSLK